MFELNLRFEGHFFQLNFVGLIVVLVRVVSEFAILFFRLFPFAFALVYDFSRFFGKYFLFAQERFQKINQRIDIVQFNWLA